MSHHGHVERAHTTPQERLPAKLSNLLYNAISLYHLHATLCGHSGRRSLVRERCCSLGRWLGRLYNCTRHAHMHAHPRFARAHHCMSSMHNG